MTGNANPIRLHRTRWPDQTNDLRIAKIGRELDVFGLRRRLLRRARPMCLSPRRFRACGVRDQRRHRAFAGRRCGSIHHRPHRRNRSAFRFGRRRCQAKRSPCADGEQAGSDHGQPSSDVRRTLSRCGSQRDVFEFEATNAAAANRSRDARRTYSAATLAIGLFGCVRPVGVDRRHRLAGALVDARRPPAAPW